MIGKPVSGDEFQKVLEKQRARDKFAEELEAELKAIQPGECLLYEARKGIGDFASIGFSLLVGRIKGLKITTEDERTYVYREK